MSLNANNLFRKEVLESVNSSLDGNVILINVPSFTKITITIVTIIAISLIFISRAKFSTYESADSLLKGSSSELKVYPRDNAVITKLNVNEGQYVDVGDDLLSLRRSSARLEGTSDMELEKNELEHQLKNLILKKIP